MTSQDFETNEITFRRASAADIDSLVDICKGGFASAIRWQGPRFLAKKFCKTWLDRSSKEVWVCLSGKEIAGFLVLVLDATAPMREIRGNEPGLLARTSALIFCPKLILLRIPKLVISYLRKNRTTFVSAPSNTQLPDSNCSKGNNVIWIAPMAVSARKWRRGFGKKILRFSEARALSLKRQTIKVSVETFNKPAISLYEKAGFTRTSEASGYIYYTKVLQNDDKRESQKQC